MILSGNSLRQRIERDRILTPFAPYKVREENGRKLAASYGLSEAGYDLRFGDQVAEILSNGEEWSPYNANQVIQSTLRTITPEEARAGLLIQPQGFMLVRSLEYIRMPADLLGIAVGKSTYARLGVVANVTPLEPGWEGYLVIELSNTGNRPVRVFPGQGIIQVVFQQISDPVIYEGKYQGQTDIIVEVG